MTCRFPDQLFTQQRLSLDDEIVVDLFAGGGGASTGLELGLQRPVNVAVNHSPVAIAVHEANHPAARHYTSDVYEVDPLIATQGSKVGWLHASPDCTHHSQARGGQPRDRKIRALSWVVLKWAGTVRPRVISMENVKQLLQWGPLVAKRDETGRVVKLDGSVAARGERVPVSEQFLVPCRKRAGAYFRLFVAELNRLGYEVSWRELLAADHGVPTIRRRLFLLARCDGTPIRWPEASHTNAPEQHPGLKPWRCAAHDCIDWSIPTKSIFERKKPLSEATLRRIARGIKRFVLEAKEPFLVRQPQRGPAGLHAVSRGGANAEAQAAAAAFLAQMNGGFNTTPGHDVRRPISTITNTGSQQQLVTADLVPVGACEAGSGNEAGAERVYGFLAMYYSNGTQFYDLAKPLPTVTTRDRMALVTVTVRGERFAIVDIGLRMLTPRELFRGQGFPDSYIIDRRADGTPLSKADSVRLVGNSVPPGLLKAIAEVNDPWAQPLARAAA